MITDFAGQLEIEVSKLAGISTDRSVHVELAAGGEFFGVLTTTPEGALRVADATAGDHRFAPADMLQLWRPGTKSPRAIAAREKAQARTEAARRRWSVTIEGGLTRRDGNTDTLAGHGRSDAKRTTETDLLHIYLAGKYNEQDDVRTTNEFFGGVRHERQQDDRRSWYARIELEFDEFEGIDLRATAAVGRGRYWIKRPDRELKTSIGLGYRREMYDDDRIEDSAVLDLGLDYRADIAPWAQLTQSTSFSPDFQEIGNFRLTLDTAVRIPFKNERLAWKLGVRNAYNSRPQPGFDRLDNTYYTSIVLTLK
ncbi:MAG: DUF481 domain-containing protein [Proteobacteria bacterium]|nr:DUF481 domain-containing protein [Pseudomonadota bacterium]